ncbi:MAG TPA: flagellar type III secretion system pore protein FliP [Kineosporiaceae bacterium]|nr:flagellar type III secretion system pore protein FliP [Kineosporiaceae bacterium]
MASLPVGPPVPGSGRLRYRLAFALLLGTAALFGLPLTAEAAAPLTAPAALTAPLTAPVPAALTAPFAAGVPVGSVTPKGPASPTAPRNPSDPSVTVSVPGQQSQVLQIILLVTVLGVAPAILLLCTSFTKIVVVLSLTRSALGTPSIPPNQVLIGLALFLSLFIMGPTVDQMQKDAIQPYSTGKLNATQAYQAATVPLREFMLKHTRDEELALMTKAAELPLPQTRANVDLRTLIPAFVLSELRGAFIIGFVIFVPFLVVDIVVSAILMSLGMVMLPPSLVSLPFKLLLFVLVDGWSLIVTTLIGSYR